ncbi:unnamed protein product [Rotaria socialis]|uniref:Uncharacterized protein n=1 Tax=Rotaria socialis TaxID=392032 RepID=A0A821T2U7_9BILA|nr:unnamed protein product [Rotaria socialis]
MGNCFPGGEASLTSLVAFDYEVDEKQVTVVSQTGGLGQGIYLVTFPGITTPIRYDRAGSIYMRHSSAPPLPHESSNQVAPTGKPSNHPVIAYAAADNQIPGQSITMIKMTEERALAIFTFHIYDNLTTTGLVQKISQTSFIAGYLIFRFNQLNDLTNEVTSITTNTHRIQSFMEYMKNIDIAGPDKQSNKIIQAEEVLSIKNLSYSSPINNKHILMDNLNLILNEGQRLLIAGLNHFFL